MGSQLVPMPLECFLYFFVAVQFTVHNDSQTFILVRNGLVTGCQVNNAEACMSQAHATVGRNPTTLILWTPMPKRIGCLFEKCFVDGTRARKYCNNSTHS